MTKKRATIQDVARAAGVSNTTVSFVLNGHDEVSPETVAAVQAVMADLGYTPRAHRNRSRNIARKAREQAEQAASAGQVALVIPDPDPAAMHTSFMEEFSPALARRLAEFELDMITLSVTADGKLPYCLANGQVQGVILRAGDITTELRESLAEVPCVQYFGVTTVEDGPWDEVVTDDEKMGRLAADYLLKRGCDELLVMNPDSRQPSYHLRSESFLFGARLAGIEASAITIKRGESLEPAIRAQTKPSGRLGIYLAGANHFNDPFMVGNWIDQADQLEPDRIRLLNIAPAPWLDAEYTRIAQHCAEQIYWRMQHPQAEHRRIMIAPKVHEKQVSSGFRVPG
jgi:DNA-binding LacI/PurR family transcriptional regulator